ncbi:hypothetical protein [Nocardia abscessus]|uniref:hypothetical protein n=1 Tax=Nocardia abscessus TaxID=120957 RepID=UPI0002D43AC0|nr:hypothetical protein [Nocardia abscessus]MCC3328228.1 hypothetical protein [Nocardia abscessus]
MDVVGNAISALAVLIGVVLGGWLTIRNQLSQWDRENERHWRDIRLSTYNDFVTAYRQYVAFVMSERVKVTAVPHARVANEMTPLFDEHGLEHKVRLESAWVATRLVCTSQETSDACLKVVTIARQMAAARASLEATEVPPDLLNQLWTAQYGLVSAIRNELGLHVMPALPGRE